MKLAGVCYRRRDVSPDQESKYQFQRDSVTELSLSSPNVEVGVCARLLLELHIGGGKLLNRN